MALRLMASHLTLLSSVSLGMALLLWGLRTMGESAICWSCSMCLDTMAPALLMAWCILPVKAVRYMRGFIVTSGCCWG